jgi:hypothetical protein
MENQDKYKTTWDRKKKIDPITGKKISDLTCKEYREYNQRQFMSRSMTNQELREQNNQPLPTEDLNKRRNAALQGKFITNCLIATLHDNQEQLKYYPDKIKEIVKSIIDNAKNGNSSMMDQLLNRCEGKVKEQIDIGLKLNELRPNQLESKELDNQFKEIPYQAAQIDSGDDLSKGIDKSIAENTEAHSVEYMKSKDQCQ